MQIRRLEEENTELRNSLSKLRSRLNQVEQSVHASGDGQTVQRQTTSHVLGLVQPTVHAGAASPSSPHPNQSCYSTGDREIQFHGPSSAMFDESRQQTIDPSAPSILIDPAKKYELLGSCIKQRKHPSLHR